MTAVAVRGYQARTMNPKALAQVCGALAVLSAGCSTTTLETGGTTSTTVHIPGAAERTVVSITDMDTVRDVAAGAGQVYVATDNGVLVYPLEGEPTATRLTVMQGLASNDVTSVVVGADGRAMAATAGGLSAISGTSVGQAGLPAPPIGEVVDMHIADDGTLWACGLEGLARFSAEGWARFGEDAHCTLLVGTPGGNLWVGTTTGLWFVERGEIVREHLPGQGIPEGFVRDVVPLEEGKCFALVQGPSFSQLAHYDGRRWYGYSIRGFERRVVGLGVRGSDILLFTPGYVLAISRLDAGGGGARLIPIHRSELFGMRSYRARITPSEDVTPMRVPDELQVRRPPQLLSRVPETQATLAAPGWLVRPLHEGPLETYLVRREGGASFAADRNRGVAQITGAQPRWLRSKDLVTQDLQIASESSGATWLMSSSGAVGRYTDQGGLQPIPTPDGFLARALSEGPQGIYVIGQVGGGNTVRAYRRHGDGWAQVLERPLELAGQPLSGIPFAGVAAGEVVWMGVQIPHEGGVRTRGVAVLDPRSEAVVYHHRASDPATDGEGSLVMPDEVTTIDLGMPEMVWMSSFYGAVRIGNHQAVVFDESRGVRGEVVTDVVVGNDSGRVWLAAAEGIGFYESSQFDFRLPARVQQARPTALAMDGRGHLWCAGPNGAMHHDGQSWTPITRGNGLPNDDLVDVEVDAHDRVWFLATDQVMIFTRPAS